MLVSINSERGETVWWKITIIVIVVDAAVVPAAIRCWDYFCSCSCYFHLYYFCFCSASDSNHPYYSLQSIRREKIDLLCFSKASRKISDVLILT